MNIDKNFIVNVALLLGLVTGATYLQKTHDADKTSGENLSEKSITQPAATNTGGEGWHVNASSTVAPASTAAPTSAAAAPATVQKPAPAPAVRRVYNRERDDD
jgi:hypothetical protein